MADANRLESSDHGDVSTPSSLAPMLDYQRLGRSHLEDAFKCILVMVPLPALSIFLWLCNMFTYMWDRGPQLCNVTFYCEELMSLPMLLAPLTTIFIVIALSVTLDHLVSVSSHFNGSTASSRTELSVEDATYSDDEMHTNSRPPRASDCESLVLRTLSIAACAMGVMWAVASLIATTNASLVIHKDFPDHSDGGKYTQRVCLGYGEALFDALLAFTMRRTATLCSMASHARVDAMGTIPPEHTPERVTLRARLSRILQDIRSVSPRHWWSKRTALDKILLLLLTSFTLTLFSFIFYAVLTSLAHFGLYNDAADYYLLCLLAFIFTWVSLFKFHSYRRAGVLPGRTARILTSGIAFFLALYCFYVAGAFIVVSLKSLLCEPGSPDMPPTQPPCVRVGSRAALDGIVAGFLNMMLACCFGGVTVMSWRAGSGIQLAEGDAREEGASSVDERI